MDTEQPSSIIATDSTPHRIDDQLLTKILEVSRRKKQLIRDLLTPQDYDSLAWNEESFDPDEEKESIKFSVGQPSISDHEFVDNQPAQNEVITITRPRSRQRSWSLHQSIERKRKAIDFFFNGSPDATKDSTANKVPNLSIELRSGYYSSSTETEENKLKAILENPTLDLSSITRGMLEILGLESMFKGNIEAEVSEDHVSKVYNHFHCLPYTSGRNLDRMIQRIKWDNRASDVESHIKQMNDDYERYEKFRNLQPSKVDNFEVTFVKSPKLLDVASRSSRSNQPELLQAGQGSVISEIELFPPIEFSSIFRRSDNHVRSTQSSRTLEGNADEFGASQEESLRHKLLSSRWLDKTNLIVYLSERENSDRSSIEKLKSVGQEDNNRQEVEKLAEGYRSIEQLRRIATRELKTLESEIRLKLRDAAVRSLKIRVALEEQTPSIGNLMSEPQLRLSHLASNLRILYSWPRGLLAVRSARRPLMPKRGNRWARPARKFRLRESEETLQMSAMDVETRLSGPNWQQLAHEHGAGQLQLVVTVQQANNLPMRVVHAPIAPRSISPLPGAGLLSPTMAGQRQLMSPAPMFYLVQPTSYVEIIFQRKQQATSLALGKNPAWNETLFLPIEHPANEVDTQLTSEFLQLNLYDHFCHSLESQQTSAKLSTDNHTGPIIQTTQQRIERRLLGQLRIPLSTILSSGRIQATFSLKQPLLLDDYQFEPENQSMASSLFIPPQESRISLFITLDPPIPIPAPMLLLPLESQELESIHELACLWQRVAISRRQQPMQSQRLTSDPGPRLGRHVRALVLQPDGRYCLILRLIGPLKPPLKLLQENGMESQDPMRLVARFVSLMSPLKYGILETRVLASQLWLDSRHLVERHLGSGEEKAILLCNYFLHLGWPSALLLGDAVPQGRCVFVIVWHSELSSSQGQLQLEAGKLLKSLGELTDQADGGLPDSGQYEEPVDRLQFIDRLPILVNSNSVQLWDPQEGRSYSTGDLGPLVSVGSIVSPENIYANVQKTDAPREVNFDIRIRNLWFPLFENQMTTSATSSFMAKQNLVSGQRIRRQLTRLAMLKREIGRPVISQLQSLNEPMNYYKISESECHKLRADIEKSVKLNLIKWRPQQPTYFNRTLSRLLADKLASFELKCVQNPVDWRNELADLIRQELLVAHVSPTAPPTSHQLISCPLNVTYTGMKPLIDTIYASGVHNADVSISGIGQSHEFGTQFFVACHVHPYPARLVSVWLYVAALMPNGNNQSLLL